MDGLALLQAADAAGLTVNVDGDKLVIRGPRSADVTARALIAHKPEIVAILSDGCLSDRTHGSVLPPSGPPKLDRRQGGVPADWHQGVCTLIALSCPASVRPPRWDRLQMDAAQFIERWAAQASSLGWGTYNVFGVNERAPFERADLAGLVRLLDGRKLVALTDADAIIECANGGHVTFRRKWAEPPIGQVLLWELGGGRCAA